MPYADPERHREASRLAMRRYYARHRERILERQREQRDRSRDRERRREREAWVQAQGLELLELRRYVRAAGLDWHHRDPFSKLFNPSHANRGLEALEAEIAKCDVLCEACHAEAHRVLREE